MVSIVIPLKQWKSLRESVGRVQSLVRIKPSYLSEFGQVRGIVDLNIFDGARKNYPDIYEEVPYAFYVNIKR